LIYTSSLNGIIVGAIKTIVEIYSISASACGVSTRTQAAKLAWQRVHHRDALQFGVAQEASPLTARPVFRLGHPKGLVRGLTLCELFA
jgi:hypothetical protein